MACSTKTAPQLKEEVRWYNIFQSETKEDMFVHWTSVPQNGPIKWPCTVGEGKLIEFIVLKAANRAELPKSQVSVEPQLREVEIPSRRR